MTKRMRLKLISHANREHQKALAEHKQLLGKLIPVEINYPFEEIAAFLLEKPTLSYPYNVRKSDK